MSNLIKYPFVNMRGKEAKVLQYEKDEEKFVPLDTKKKVLIKSLDEVEQEKLLKEEEREKKQEASDSGEADEKFEAGVPVANFDEVFEKKQEEAEKAAEEMMAKAKEEAEAILAEAHAQVDEIRAQAQEEGHSIGYQEGMNQAMEEIDEMRSGLQKRKSEQEREYQTILSEVEEHYVEIVCQLLRKLTGVVVAEGKDVILYLIRSGISSMEPAGKYIIRVSTHDLLYVEGKKEEIVNKTGITGTVDIQEEKSLSEGECMIETDRQMIDCGLRTQLENMITTLRMLA